MIDTVTAVPASAIRPVQMPSYQGRVSSFYSIYLKMWLLTLLTLGVYRYWGRTDVRRYIWSHIRIANEQFAYLGTGGELFKSSIKYVLLIFLPIVILSAGVNIIFHGGNKTAEIIANIFIGFLLYVMYFPAKFMGLRYRMGRTSWRGIRFELRGKVKAYVSLRLKNAVFNVLSLGLYKPIGDVAVLNLVINNAYFGTLPFRYCGQREELQKIYYLCWLLALPTLGCSLVWYKAKYIAHVAKYTRLDKMEFRMKFTGWEYFRFTFANLLLIVFTLGLAYPYVAHRRIRIYVKHARFRGMIDESAIAQAQQSKGAEGGDLVLGFDDFGF